MTSTKDASNRIRIAILDDDDLFRESLGLNLIDEGYEVASFAGGPPALAHFAAGGHADVILLDWRMPGMNGLEVLRALRRSGNTTPVIFPDDAERRHLRGGGARGRCRRFHRQIAPAVDPRETAAPDRRRGTAGDGRRRSGRRRAAARPPRAAPRHQSRQL